MNKFSKDYRRLLRRKRERRAKRAQRKKTSQRVPRLGQRRTPLHMVEGSIGMGKSQFLLNRIAKTTLNHPPKEPLEYEPIPKMFHSWGPLNHVNPDIASRLKVIFASEPAPAPYGSHGNQTLKSY